MFTRRAVLKAGARAAAVPFIYGCSSAWAQVTSAAKTASIVKRGGTFAMARTGVAKSFNGVEMTRANHSFTRALYNMLVRLDKDLNPQPELATSWQFSPDGLTMTLKLRQDVKFHSGREFTSEDVKFSWEFAKDPTTASPLRQLFSLIRDVKTPDKATIELRFDKPCANIFDVLDTLCMFDKSVVEKLSTTDAGSGPFKVVGYIPGSEIRMGRFDGYWEPGKPYLDEYIVRTIPDEAAMVINLETKVLDAIWAPALHEVVRLKAQPGLVTDPGVGAQGMFHLMANITKGPLGNKKVRQAINYAIDRERCARMALAGTIEPTCLMWPRGSWAYFADLEGRYSYDLTKAKTLLAEAGYPSGFETSIILSRKDNPSAFPIGQIIQGDLAKIGIRTRIEDLDVIVWEGRNRRGDFELCVHTYGRANRDPGTMLAGALVWYPKAEKGLTGFDSADFVKWRDEAVTIFDREARKPLYRKIQEYALDESFSMAIAGNQSFWIYRDYTKGIWYSRESSPFVADVWLDK
jgi:peptide/nickel transport system substrate-binding protein